MNNRLTFAFASLALSIFALANPSQSLAGPRHHGTKEWLILDHDGGVDDLSALIIALGANRYDLKAVTIQPADSIKESALKSTQEVLDRLGAVDVKIAISDLEGLHPFPMIWRRHSDHTAEVLSKLTLPHLTKNPVVQQTAPELLADLLSKHSYTLILTGPLSNLAAAIRLNPAIKKNINRMYIMGGAVDVSGNVEEFKNAGEWNFYNSPIDAHDVIHSELASKITLVGLDATRHVPVKRPFSGNILAIDKFEQQSHHYRASQIAHAIWNIVYQDPIQKEIYQFWDTLTAIAAVDPDTIHTERTKIRVRTDIEYEGRTEATTASEGVVVNVATGVNFELFQKVLLKRFKYGKLSH